MNRQRWLRTRRGLDRQVVDRAVEQFRRDTQPMVERALFFGEGGPEQFGTGDIVEMSEREIAERPDIILVPNSVAR